MSVPHAKGSAPDNKTYKATEARQNFSEIIDKAVHDGPVFVERRRQRVVILRAEHFDELVSREAHRDANAADEALRDYLKNGGVPLSQLKEELGLD